MKKQSLTRMLLLFVIVTLTLEQSAYAYLDPGSGSYILQLIMAAAVACIFAIKMFFSQIKVFFQGLFSKKDKKSEDDNPA